MQPQIVIIGAGVVGLAVAARISESRKNIFLIEKNASFGQETSSRNSEVIHAGIYYPKDSLKASLCIEGNRQLYALCKAKRIPYRKCGKIIVAVDETERPQLEAIRAKAIKNGVFDLQAMTKQQIQKKASSIKASAGLFSPSTGIIDSHRYMRHLAAGAQKNGVNFVYNTSVERVQLVMPGVYRIHVRYPDGNREAFNTTGVINCAGLAADFIAASMGLDIDALLYRQYLWKGEYFSIETANDAFHHLVYPVPRPNNEGLGIHITIDLKGRVKLGPNAIYLKNGRRDYHVDRSAQQAFHVAVKRYFPSLRFQDLNPEMAGIRPKLQKPGDPVRDFIINEESDKGLPGIVNLIGIESPGLTASRAIADYVMHLLKSAGI